MEQLPDILFEDNHCLGLCKPAGIPTQAPEPFESLELWTRNYLKGRYQKTGRPYLGIPHRLDRPVSGCVLFAKSSKAAARFAEQFRDRTTKKTYLALVELQSDSELPNEMYVPWKDYLRKLPGIAKGEVCTANAPEAQEASLETRLLKKSGHVAMLELMLHTGRMHQIRLQASSRNLPIVNDFLYGAIKPSSGMPENTICLHAWKLQFLHPIRYETVVLQSGLPQCWPKWTHEVLPPCE